MVITLLICSMVVIVCIALNKVTHKWGLPALFIFIALGMVFGSDGLFKIQFDNYRFAEQICSFALIFIMFYGGFGTNWKMARPVAGKAVCLSTLGVVLTAAATGVFCFFALGFDAYESFLIGAVISSTDAASVFSILRSKRLNLKYSTASLLEVESGSNDPASYMLTIAALSLLQGKSLGSAAYMVFAQLVYGAIIGVAVALIAVSILKNIKFAMDGFDTIFVLAVCVLAYALPTIIGGNGYLAAYLAGIILGNSSIKNKVPLVHFFDGVNGLSQILIFFLLGLLAFPSQIPSILLPAVLIALFLMFVARPLAVFLLLTPFRCTIRQQLLVSWAGLRGAASIVFAIMATVSDAYIGNDVFHIVFLVSLVSVALQGTFLPFVAKKLNMVDTEGSVLKTFNDYQEKGEMQLIKTHIHSTHPWAGRSIGDLNLVVDTVIVMIKRGDEILVPRGDTVIMAEDILVMNSEMYQDDDDVTLNEIKIGKGHHWAGLTIRELPLSKQQLVVIIKKPDGTTVMPKGKTVIEPKDTLVVSGWRNAK